MLVEEKELRHYGVLGMRWGVRHDRNRSSGRRRSKNRASAKADTIDPKQELRRIKQSRRQKTRDAKQYAKYADKNRWNLSDDELDTQIKRLQKQKQLRELTKSERTNEAKTAAKSVAKDVAKTALTIAAAAAVTYAIDSSLNSSDNRSFASLGKTIVDGLTNRYALKRG